MDSRVKLLKKFFNTLQMDRAKLETCCYGFDFLDKIISDGIELEYGELLEKGLIQRYRLSKIPESRMNSFLQAHINKEYNVCLYFDENANNLFSFNLDNNFKDGRSIPELESSVNILTANLKEFCIEPLTFVSGRGYHLWCRFDAAINNQQLYEFALRIAAKTAADLNKNGYDYTKVKFRMYPNPKFVKMISLRLFGSIHIRNKVFSHIQTSAGMLDEAASWEYFADYLQHKTIPKERFMQAHNLLMHYFYQRA